MLDFQTKLKRQIALVGMAIDNSGHLKDADFAAIFDRDIPTIKRDLQELRSYGIDIHSEKKRGICLANAIEPAVIRGLTAQFLAICSNGGSTDKATSLLVKQLKERALSTVVTLQQSIDRRTIVTADYQKDADTIERGRELCPLVLFSSDGSWRVLALNDGRMKQYHLNKLLHVRAGERRFKRIPEAEIEEMFRYSFRSWLGNEKHRIRIRLSPEWASRIKPRQLMETQVITEESDGSVVFESIVNSLAEVAGWVVSRGKGVEVLEPGELKAKVIELANGALSNYGSRERAEGGPDNVPLKNAH